MQKGIICLDLLGDDMIVNRVLQTTGYTCDMIMVHRMCWESQEELPAAADTANRGRRMPQSEVKIWYGFCEHGAHANHGETADHEVAPNGAAGSDCSTLSHKRG